EFAHADCCVELDASWDLWQRREDWNLEPAPVTLMCFGPRFESDEPSHLRIDFGLDSLFLPNPSGEGSLRMRQSNLRSLLHLVNDIEKGLPLDSRQLWSESGANFAEMLSQTLSKLEIN